MCEIKIIGTVKSEKTRSGPHFPFHTPAEIQIKPEYAPALKNLEHNSHIWVICLYDPKNKEELQVKPRRVDHSLGMFGTLALRTPNHPNPLGLTLTRLLKVKGSTIFVDRLDAFDGTPVIDIKPYYEHDIVFSPEMPDIRHTDQEQRQIALLELAINHHGEYCPSMALAVKMILAAESRGIIATAPCTRLDVVGGGCLADNLQGLCKARFANPPRFAYTPLQDFHSQRVNWSEGSRRLTIALRPNVPENFEEILQMTADNLFIITEDF